MASAAANIRFSTLTPAQLRQWVEDHPGHVEDKDMYGFTALHVAAVSIKDPALVEWLLDAQAADVNGRLRGNQTALHGATTPVIVRALLERHADPTLFGDRGFTVLMAYIGWSHFDCIAPLLEDRRVVTSINASIPQADSSLGGWTALHVACSTPHLSKIERRTILRLLLPGGGRGHLPAG